MRLFVAIRFDAGAENHFANVLSRFRAHTASGSFTRRENLHLTLAFLGETHRLREAKRAVAAVQAEPFTLLFGDLGRFRRDGGDIYWVGAEESEPLQRLHRALGVCLSAEGFPVDDRPYQPHLTLGRRVVAANGFDRAAFSAETGDYAFPVKTISLMESSRVRGVLTYTPLLDQELQIV